MRWDRPAGEGTSSEILDWPSLRSRVGGDLGLLREMVVIFAAEYRLMLEQLETAIERGEASGVEKMAHKLKGSLVQFSAGAATETARRLENLGKTNALEGAGAAVRGLRREIEELIGALNALLSRRVNE
ncbi:MAG TPA: Hpt domain-containing protein [Candidatus Angelobacter sp.]